MPRIRTAISSCCLLAALVTVACSGGRSRVAGERDKVKGDRTMVSHAEGVEPLWIQECPARTDHILPFCGESHKQASQKLSCSEAYADALGKLRRTIGQKVDAKLVSDGQGGYRFEIQGASEALTLRGVWEDQRWFEEYQGPGGHTYDCYIMLVYPALEYDNLQGMARKAAADKVRKAGELHAEARQLASSGRHAEAKVLLERAKGLLSGLREPVVNQEGDLNSPLLLEQVVADLSKSAAEAGKVEKTALVVLHLLVDGKKASRKQSRAFHTKVKDLMSGHGIRCRPGGLAKDQLEAVLEGDRESASRAAAEKGAGLLVVIDLEAEYLGKDDMFHYAQTSGSFRLIRTADGRELASVPLGPEKQGHPTRRGEAANNSIRKLRDKFLANAVRDALQKL